MQNPTLPDIDIKRFFNVYDEHTYVIEVGFLKERE